MLFDLIKNILKFYINYENSSYLKALNRIEPRTNLIE